MWVKDTIGNKYVFEVSLDSFNGSVILYGIASILEQYMRDEGLSYLYLSIIGIITNADNDEIILLSKQYHIVYCCVSHYKEAKSFIDSYFLTSLTSKVTHKSIEERLSFFAEGGATITETFKIVVCTNGTNQVIRKTRTSAAPTNNSVVEKTYSYDAIAEIAGIDKSTTIIKAFTVCVGDRSFT